MSPSSPPCMRCTSLSPVRCSWCSSPFRRLRTRYDHEYHLGVTICTWSLAMHCVRVWGVVLVVTVDCRSPRSDGWSVLIDPICLHRSHQSHLPVVHGTDGTNGTDATKEFAGGCYRRRSSRRMGANSSDEVVDVLNSRVDRCESDECHMIESGRRAFHDLFADFPRRNFAFEMFVECRFDVGDDATRWLRR